MIPLKAGPKRDGTGLKVAGWFLALSLTILSANLFLFEDIPRLPPNSSLSFCIAHAWELFPKLSNRYCTKFRFSCHFLISLCPKLFCRAKV